MFDLNIAVLRPSERLKSLPKRSDAGLHLGIMFGECVQKHDPPHPRWLLRPRRERPADRRAAEQGDELAPVHSITSSAVICMINGTVSPSAFAVLRLINRSSLTGCCTGKSAGFSPLRMRLV